MPFITALQCTHIEIVTDSAHMIVYRNCALCIHFENNPIAAGIQKFVCFCLIYICTAGLMYVQAAPGSSKTILPETCTLCVQYLIFLRQVGCMYKRPMAALIQFLQNLVCVLCTLIYNYTLRIYMCTSAS